MSDFKLINRAFLLVAQVERTSGIGSLSRPEQVLLYTWHATGIISNGGLRYFHEIGLDTVTYATAFKEVGLSEMADALWASLNLLGGNLPSSDRTEIMNNLERNKQALDGLSRVFWRGDQLIIEMLAIYIKDNYSSINAK